MDEEKLKNFLNEIFSLQVIVQMSDKSTFETNLISRDGRTIFEQALRNFLLENRNKKIGILDARVYAYEQIIANSNFAPIVPNQKSPGFKNQSL